MRQLSNPCPYKYNDFEWHLSEIVLVEVIADCIAKGILVDFLTQRGDEIRKMTHLDFTFERREKLIYRDAKQEGFELGIERGIEQGIERGIERGIEQGMSLFIQRLIQNHYSKDKILELGVTEEEYETAEKALLVHS